MQRVDKSWHQVSAVLLEPVPGPLFSGNGANSWLVWSPARWVAGGHPRTGDVPAPAGASAGTAVTVWLNRAGKVQTPPLTAAGARNRILIAVMFALAGLHGAAHGCCRGRPVGARPQADRKLGGWLAFRGSAVEPPAVAGAR